MDLSERIATWRRAKGLSQQDLAEAVGVTVAAVYQWEAAGRHRTKPSVSHLEKVVKAFRITMEQFYGRPPRDAKAS